MEANKQPTQEQIKEFWEWCGCQVVMNQHFISEDLFYFDVVFPDGKEIRVDELIESIDLNNLFKYAVPAIRKKELWLELLLKTGIVDQIWEVNIDPALALFWAIWEVMKGK